MNEANERYLKNLDSIFQQSYNNYKVYYVDDASSDKTAELVSKYMEKHKLQNKMTFVKN
jgi:glycosyltransferase involved in cell wall biosynthesis